MSAFSTAMQNIALNLLTEFGEAVTFSRVVYGEYDVNEGTTSPSSTTTFSGVAAPVDYSESEIDGTIIKRGDIKATVAKMSTTPVVGDTVLLGGTTYRVMNVMKTKISGQDVIYDLQLRI